MLTKLRTNKKVFELLNQSIPVLMGVLLFIYPFPHITSIKEISFYLAVGLVIILRWFYKIEFSLKSPLAIPFGLFVFWAALSSFFALDRANTIHDVYAHLLEYIIIYYILINFFNSKKSFTALIWITIISLSVISFGCMVYFYVIKGMPIDSRLGVPQAYVPINSIGLITVPSMFLQLLMFKNQNKLYLKMILLFFIIISSLALLLSGTNGAIIGLLFPLLILLPKNKKVIIIFAICFFILTGLLPANHLFTANNLKSRWKAGVRPNIWYSYYQMIKDNPVIGTGFGQQIYDKKLVEKYNAKLPAKYKLNYPFHPHNILVDITVRTGFVGLVLFLYLIVSSLWTAIKTIRYTADDFIKNWMLCITAVFTSILIQSMFTDTLLGKQAYLFYLAISLIAILWRLDAEAVN